MFRQPGRQYRGDTETGRDINQRERHKPAREGQGERERERHKETRGGGGERQERPTQR